MNNRYIAALDIGGTKMVAMVAGREGVLARVTQPTAKSGSERALPELALEMIDSACRQAGIDCDEVDTVGVASCGPFVRKNGMTALSAPNICGKSVSAADLPNDWALIPLEEVLRERFDHVAVENDCVAALIAERTFGAVRDEPDCAYVTWSTGIGFGLCVDGHILRGKNGNAGHAGHMLLTEQLDALCGCGNRGDVEGLISGRNLGNRLNTTAADLFARARKGDQAAREVAVQAAQWFGRALYNVAATLDTRIFVIGGSVWMHHGDWMTPLVLREITSRLPALTEGVSVMPAQLGTSVADIGALSLVIPEEWIVHWRQTESWRARAN